MPGSVANTASYCASVLSEMPSFGAIAASVADFASKDPARHPVGMDVKQTSTPALILFGALFAAGIRAIPVHALITEPFVYFLQYRLLGEIIQRSGRTLRPRHIVGIAAAAVSFGVVRNLLSPSVEESALWSRLGPALMAFVGTFLLAEAVWRLLRARPRSVAASA